MSMAERRGGTDTDRRRGVAGPNHDLRQAAPRAAARAGAAAGEGPRAHHGRRPRRERAAGRPARARGRDRRARVGRAPARVPVAAARGARRAGGDGAHVQLRDRDGPRRRARACRRGRPAPRARPRPCPGGYGPRAPRGGPQDRVLGREQRRRQQHATRGFGNVGGYLTDEIFEYQ